jgi:methylenetetrahydrofolate dehydrogenase (NADP+)/methenyltetrahydrofolate cyclohydrolase
MAHIIDGSAIARKIKERLKAQVKKLPEKPGLAVVMVGTDPASKVYIAAKIKACREAGYYSEKILLPEGIKQNKLNGIIEKLNEDSRINGILIQHPLPEHLSYEKTINIVNPEKDVDGLTAVNMGRLVTAVRIADNMLIPCTAKGIITLIDSTGVTIKGKSAVIVGRSVLVGKPLVPLLLKRDATVTVCHSKTPHLGEYTKRADILVAAVGKPELITADMVKEGAVVIDAGINKAGTELVGDVEFEEVSKIASSITPVPGGVGPMTIASLLENTLIAYRNQKCYS